MKSDKKSNPFQDNPEQELKRRLKHGKPLTRKEFNRRLQEIREQTKTSKD